MFRYRTKLQRDLARWRDRGLITPEALETIEADLAGRRDGPDVTTILAILGAVLLAFAAMTFVASNWQAMSRGSRLALLGGGLWLTYGLTYLAARAGAKPFREAGILFAAALYGAAIMLIAQMYHIDGHPPDGVFAWWAGVLFAGALLVSAPAMVLSVLLASLWSTWEAILSHGVHWWFLPAWLVMAFFMVRTRWRAGIHLMAIALGFWIILLGFLLPGAASYWLVTIIGLALIAVSLVLEGRFAIAHGFERAGAVYGLIIAYAGLFCSQFLDWYHQTDHLAWATGSLVLLIAMMVVGTRRSNRPLVWFAYAGITIELLGIYFRTLGTLLGTSVFFLSAGLLLFAMAGLAWWLHRSMHRSGGATP